MTPTPQAQAFAALLTDALTRRHAIRLPPYRVPVTIAAKQPLTPEQAEHQRQARGRISDWDES
jgi:hypothetical protein